MAALGYVKDVDWIEELITVPEDEATIQRWEKISDFVLKRHRLHIHEARNRLSYLPLLKPFSSWSTWPTRRCTAPWISLTARSKVLRQVRAPHQSQHHLLRHG